MDNIIKVLNNLFIPLKFIVVLIKKIPKFFSEVYNETVRNEGYKPIGEIGSGEARSIIILEYTKVTEIKLYDDKYRIYRNEDISKWLSEDNTKLHQYIADFYDCDDFAITMLGKIKVAFPGLCIGEVLVSWDDNTGWHGHDVIGFIDENKKFRYIEPQSATIFTRPENWNRDWVRI